jgi:hypothetical protein
LQRNNKKGTSMLIWKLEKFIVAAAAVAAIAALGACSKSSDSASAAADAGPACKRQCLIDATNAYVAALAAHSPAKAPLADNIVFVENVTKMKPGEGLWKTIVAGPGAFVIRVPDEVNQTAGYLAMMTYMGPAQAPQDSTAQVRAEFAKKPAVAQPVIVAIRLKFDDKGKISEAEHLLSGVRDANMVNLRTPRPGIFTEIPAAQRKPHDELVKIGASYYDALDDNNGDLMPFAPDCERHENGMITASANPSSSTATTSTTAPVDRHCKEQLTSNTFQYIARIENRRVFAADPQTGLVMGLSHFRHPMDNLPYKVKALDGSSFQRTKKNFTTAPFDLPAAHIFKIGADGLVHEIEAMGFIAPTNSPTGWE